MTRSVVRSASLAVLAAAVACSDGTSPSDGTSVSLSVVVPGSPAAQLSGPARVVTLDDGNHTLVLTRVALVLREIELERVETVDCVRSGELGDDDGCEEFEVGPFLVELPMNGQVEQLLSVDVPAGAYDELELELHKPEDDGSDAAFILANPSFAGVSIRVEGTFDGQPFVFLQDVNEEQELDLVPALVVEEGSGPTNLTLEIDVTAWFKRSDGTLVDPATANQGGPAEALVEENIRQSIDAFRDHDHDGEHDD